MSSISFLYKNQPFDSAKDLAPVIVIARVPNIIYGQPRRSGLNLKELIDLVKAQPGKLSYATAGIGGTGHVAMELLKSMTGMDILHVPYRGSAPAFVRCRRRTRGSLVGQFAGGAAVRRCRQAGALAVTTTKRWPELPDVPTVAEAGVPGYEASAWFTIAAPAKTPREIIDKVNASVNKYMSEPETIARMRKLGAEPVGGSPEDMAKLIAEETVKWKKVDRLCRPEGRPVRRTVQ